MTKRSCIFTPVRKLARKARVMMVLPVWYAASWVVVPLLLVVAITMLRGMLDMSNVNIIGNDTDGSPEAAERLVRLVKSIVKQKSRRFYLVSYMAVGVICILWLAVAVYYSLSAVGTETSSWHSTLMALSVGVMSLIYTKVVAGSVCPRYVMIWEKQVEHTLQRI